MHNLSSEPHKGSFESQDYLSVIIPAYNEEKRIPSTLANLEKIAGETNMEIIVVCDGCKDNTVKVIENWTAKLPIKIISYEDNRGKGYAVRKGILGASGDIIAFMDADGSTPPAELLRLVKPLKSGQTDIVIGSRRIAGAKVKRQPIHRHLLGGMFSLLTRSILSLPCHDTQCGCKLFRRNIARLLFRKTKCDGFEFDLDILYLAHSRGLRIKEIGVIWSDVAGSKVNVISDGFKMFRAVLAIRASYIPFVKTIRRQYTSILSWI